MRDRRRLEYAQMVDPGARAVLRWTTRRAALEVMRREPDLRPLADAWERRWYGGDE